MNSLASINATSTNITQSAYLTLIASTSAAFSKIFATDTTGEIIVLAMGAAGHEVDLVQLPADASGIIPMPSPDTVPVGSRLSVKAITADATSGFSAVTLLS